MDHFPRFRRKKDVATPTIITNPAKLDLSARKATTPPPGDLQPGAVPAPMRPIQKLSPFRVFHRSSGKRARDSPPASLPHSPTAAPVLANDGSAERPISPLSPTTDDTASEAGSRAHKRPPKIPAFLELSVQEIMKKFEELTWLERHRVRLSMQNPSPDFRWARPTGPHIKSLDRYVNIQPWYNNRVKLQVPDGQIDYINASPILLYPSQRRRTDGSRPQTRDFLESDRYIAMQGPKEVSTDHVWRMVVEQLESPGVIVMLTETHEGNAEKCYPYFPMRPEDAPLEINEQDEFGDGFRATVRCEGTEETPAGDAIELRKLVIRVHSRRAGNTPSRQNGTTTPEPSPTLVVSGGEGDEDEDVKMKSPLPPGSETTTAYGSTASLDGAVQEDGNDTEDEEEVEERIVWHFLYKNWPDYGIPSLADLDSFFTLMRLSREKNAGPMNPRIVHCSAGVGRTGTFIALEHLMRELDAGVLEHYDELEVTQTPTPTSQHGTEGEEGNNNNSPSTQASSIKEEEGEDLIFQTVNSLREQRRTMVQAESQYLFIYQVLRKLWLDKYGTEDGSGGGEPAAKRLEVDPFIEG
ncbi:tyrosine-protein phosphatase 1 [Diplogelasinospora grovesii]|uniref:Tyrosine-protein phosphatase 1 n=1 Tax=Diplogelasinospora grovesii TaxID=303347 RepID=A0AAN6S663_9PEZI|nr:tyrosine-protein phosphatase 1 [Diplogelasinospora grovesii]